MTDDYGWGIDWAAQGLSDVVAVGRGGQATVVRAWQESTQRQVAVKIVRLASDGSAGSRFWREVRAIGSLSGHPNVVTIYEPRLVGNDMALILLEYLSEGSLADRVRRSGAMPWPEVVDVGLKISAGLQFAHTSGVIHGDVKPQNVLIAADGQVKLSDFGIARLMGEDETRTPAPVSRYHAAPEVLSGEQQASVASDIYSLGSTLYMLLSGHPPVLGRNTEPQQYLDDLRFKDVPEFLVQALMKAMAKDPERRPGTVQEVADEIRIGLLKHEATTGATPSGPSEYPGTGPDRDDQETIPPPPTPGENWREGRDKFERIWYAPPRTDPDPLPERADPTPGRRITRPVVVAVSATAAILVAIVAALILTAGGGERRQSAIGTDTTASSTTARSTTSSSAVPATVTSSTITGGNDIFGDAFSNPSSGWQAQSLTTVTYGYVSGEYQILLKTSYSHFYAYPNALPEVDQKLKELEGDVRVEVQARNRSASLGEFGVMCRYDRPKGWMYRASIQTDGTWVIWRIDPASRRLAFGKNQFAALSGQPEGTYQIRFECTGAGTPAVLRLFVNGGLVADATDGDGFKAGGVGLYAASLAQPEVDVRFDNFIVSRP